MLVSCSPSVDPATDLVLDQQQPVPRGTVSLSAFRPDSVDHRADQVVGQLLGPAPTDHAELDRRVDVTPRRLAVDTGPLSDRPKAELGPQPVPQNLSHLVHTNLPERHPQPPDRTT